MEVQLEVMDGPEKGKKFKFTEPETFISQPKFLKFLEARARVYGFKIGKEYGEPFFCEEEIEMDFGGMLNQF